jgi:hypothetical protein
MNAPDMGAYLRRLIGNTIPTMTGRPNKIMSVVGDTVIVGTRRSPNGSPVSISQVQAAADQLYANGELLIDKRIVGYRSALIGAVLQTLPGARAELRPRRIVLER